LVNIGTINSIFVLGSRLSSLPPSELLFTSMV